MLSRNQIKLINSLKIRKYRKLHQQFIAEGNKLVLDILESSFKTDLIFATSDWADRNHSILQKHQIKLIPVSTAEMEQISALTTASEVLSIVKIQSQQSIEEISFDDIIIALDQISDPGNMGTIIRTADWFGIRNIICSPDCVEVFNPKVIQATMGSIARVKITSYDLNELQAFIPSDFPVYGTFLEGDNLVNEALSKKGLIIIGNESKGIDPKLNSIINHRIHIPFYSNGSKENMKAESLNAAVATAILLFEFRRKQ